MKTKRIKSFLYRLKVKLDCFATRKKYNKSPFVVTDEMRLFIISRNIFTQSDWLQLEKLINQTQNQFVRRLRNEYSVLTEDDVHIILLLRADIGHAQIAEILNIQMASFRMRRSRIKKKMKQKNDSFTNFIKTLYV